MIYPMMKDFIKYQTQCKVLDSIYHSFNHKAKHSKNNNHVLSRDYGANNNHHLFSMSTSNELSVSRKKRKRKSKIKKSDSLKIKDSVNKKNSFIHKLTKRETEASQETAATIGNIKKEYFNKSKIKRIKGILQVCEAVHIASPPKSTNMMRSMDTGFKGSYENITKSIESTKNASSFDYTPNLIKELSSK